MAEQNHLSVKLRHKQGSLLISVDFDLSEPWTVLFGPSGSGKSTILRAISGFVPLRDACISIGSSERVLVDTAKRIFVAPHLRPVRGAGQAPRLFPKLSVRQNLEYGLGWESSLADHAEDAESVVNGVLRLFRLSTLAGRRPNDLSGGEQQRASVARAVVSAVTFDGPGPALLLLDEPFSGLDAVLRDELAIELRAYLKRWRVPVLSVSHDVSEAFLLEAHVIRIAEGQILNSGPVELVLRGERERLLAGLQR